VQDLLCSAIPRCGRASPKDVSAPPLPPPCVIIYFHLAKAPTTIDKVKDVVEEEEEEIEEKENFLFLFLFKKKAKANSARFVATVVAAAMIFTFRLNYCQIQSAAEMYSLLV